MTSDRLRIRLLWGFVVASMLTGVQLASTAFVFGDVVLVLTVGFSWLNRDAVLQHRRGLGAEVPGLGILAIAIGLSILRNFDQPAYGGVEAVGSMAKLSLYILSLYLFLNLLKGLRTQTTVGVLRLALRMFLGLALLQQMAHWLGLRLPLLRPIEVSFDRAGAVVPRAFGLFSEPSTMAIFVVVAAFFLHSKSSLRRNDTGVVILSLAISASLSGIGLGLLSILGLAFSTNPELRTRTLKGTFIGACLSAVILLAVPSLAETVKVRFVDRVVQTLTFEDASGSGRLFDSWTAAIAVADDQPIAGVGVGGLPEQIRLLPPDEKQNISPGIINSGAVWNIFANAFAEMGLIGLFAVLYGVWRLTEGSSAARTTIIGVGFATGVFFGWTWWFSLGLINQSIGDDDQPPDDEEDDPDAEWTFSLDRNPNSTSTTNN